MSFIIGSIGSARVLILVPKHQAQRLQGKCFRVDANNPNGKRRNLRLAGNFRTAQTFEQVYKQIAKKFNCCVFDAIHAQIKAEGERARQASFTESFEIEAGRPIGWSSTAPLKDFQPDQLIDFELNRGGWGKKVRFSAGVLAPLTATVTIICSIRYNQTVDEWCVMVESLYPGKDIGELRGNISEAEGIAFFDFAHQGEGG